jgi:hypothetical protein
MGSSRTCAVLAFVCVGCVGEIHGRGPDPGTRAPDPPAGNKGQTPPGTTVVPPAATGCTPTRLPPARAWRLTHTQYRNTLLDVFGYAGRALDSLPADARVDGFANRSDGLGVPSLLLEHYLRVSDEVAARVLERSGEFLGCPVAQLGQGSCLADFLKTVGRKAWRRGLTDTEVGELQAVFKTAAADGPESGLKSVIEGLLASPSFLFRTELGGQGAPGAAGGTTRLTDEEIASALSYTLWDAPPDATLLDLAGAGKLHDAQTLGAQVMRMLGTARRPRDTLNNFLRQWLKIDDLGEQDKDGTLFPGYSRQVGADLLAETRMFFDGVVFEPGGDRSLRTLLTASYGYVNARTAFIYGLPPAGADLARADLDRTQRRGLLTSAAFLAAHAGADATKVVDRGAFFREEILCADVPAPPGNFRFEDANITEDMTARQKLDEHVKNPACKGCHELFDGIGFALENYDAVGRFRTTENKKPIDPSGTTPLPASGMITFANFVDLIDKTTKLPDVYDCFAQQYAGYALGRLGRELDGCERGALGKSFAQSGYRLDALVRAVVTSPSFIVRQN